MRQILKEIFYEDPEILNELAHKELQKNIDEIPKFGIDIPIPKDGVDGIDGQDGRDGVDGTNGKNGRDGFDGKDGKDGIDGKDGEDAEIEDIIKELKKKQYLETKDIKGLNMNDMRWHGGGLSSISHDSTITGTGTTSSPLSVVSVAVAKGTITIGRVGGYISTITNVKGIITTISRNIDNSIASLTNGTNTWTINRSGGAISSIDIT